MFYFLSQLYYVLSRYYFTGTVVFADCTYEIKLKPAIHFMEDKAMKSRRNDFDRCNDGSLNVKKHNHEFCYEDNFAVSRSSNSPGYHKKTSHFASHVEKDSRNEDSLQSSTNSDRCRDQKQKDHKAEVHRLAEYVCGDWSEHVSSSGKRYYYNCKTEVSQWEKPKDWTDVADVSQAFQAEPAIHDRSVDCDGSLLHSSIDVEDGSNHRQSFNPQKIKASVFSSSQTAFNSSLSVTSNVSNMTVHNSSYENDIRHRLNTVKSSSLTDSFENCHRVDSQSSLPVCVSGIYGLVSSSRESSSGNHNGSKSEDSNRDIRMTTADEDMDISPGSTPTEESLLEKRLSAIGGTTDLSKSASSPTANQDHADDPCLCGTAAVRNSSPSSATFLSTLTSLQQALHHVTPAGSSVMTKSVPTSTLNLLASLPSLVTQLQEAERGPSAMVVSSQSQQSNQQHILQQVIQMLQKLQQALVAQQQQQQQRQLQDLLRQLLSMQKHGSTGTTLSLSSQQQAAMKNISVDGSCDNAKLESPYSPPDSDGTPLGSPENHQFADCENQRQANDVIKSSESPKSNEQGASSSIIKLTVNSPDRTVAASPAVAGSSNAVLIVIPGTVQSAALVGTSHLTAGVLRKPQDSIGLTPSLANYVNNRLLDHISGWQTDAIERQVTCYSEESNSISSLQCAQISVDLKQARSLVRLNEIQTTLQEQRVMFIRQQTKDLENMRTGFVFQTNVHNHNLDT